MSGILDSKSRVLDTIVTLEGRRQIADGKLKIEYVSFSDAITFYEADVVSGSSDASARLSFEQCHLPQDQITFEGDDSGLLQPFKGSATNVSDGKLFEYTFNVATSSIITGSSEGISSLSGTAFAEAASGLLSTSNDSFRKLRVISTFDSVFDDDGFDAGNRSITFQITDSGPIERRESFSANVNHLESIFNDSRVSKLDNFSYLPPLNRVDDNSIDKSNVLSTKQKQLGTYKPWGRTQQLSGAQLEHELRSYERRGYCKTIVFDPTSRDNRLLGQFFEINHDVLRKLDIIDFGQYNHKGSLRHAFFIGRLFVDDNDSHTFVHMFTLVFG